MIVYLKDHIIEEITGGADYMSKAVEHKGTHCGNVFYQMAQMELEHANALSKMMQKEEKPDEMTDAEYAAVQKSVLDAYTTYMPKIESMKKVFWS